MKLWTLAFLVPLALTAAPAALAASAEQGYGGRGGVQGEIAQTAGGTLPFTGLDLVFLAVGGVMLLLVGVALRHAARQG